MEINTNYAQTNTYTQTSTKNDESETSFDNYMNTNDDNDSQTTSSTSTSSTEDYIEVSDTTEENKTLTYTQDVAQVEEESYDPNKRYLNLVDKYMPNYFEENDISKEDEEVIRAALADNKISDKEVKSMSFEQAQYTQKLKFDLMDYGTQNDVPVMWMTGESLNVQHVLGATTFTKDDTFNKAIFQTFVENPSLNDEQMMSILGELSYTLKQEHSGIELGPSMSYAFSPSELLGELEGKDIDYDDYLTKLLNKIQTFADEPIHSKLQEQYDFLMMNFGQILDNYKELQEN